MSVIPIMPGRKCPGEYINGIWRPMLNWTLYSKRLPNDKELDDFSRWSDAGIGLCLGSTSGVIAIDRDYDQGVWDDIEKVIPQSPIKKMGAKGYTGFFKFSGQKSRVFNVNGKSVLEILSDGRQTVMPPTIHPDTGQPYKWISGSLDDLDDLPEFPDDVIKELERITGHKVIQYKSGDGIWRHINEEALHRLDEWIPLVISEYTNTQHGYRCRAFWRGGTNVMSVSIHKSGIKDFGIDEALTPINFVIKASTEPMTPDKAARWLKNVLDIKDPSTVTIAKMPESSGNIVKAMGGAIVIGKTCPDVDATAREEVSGHTDTNTNRKVKGVGAAGGFTGDLLRPPGILGDLVRWINDTSLKPQPELAIPAAISTLGTILSHRVQSPTGLRTNFLMIGTGASGCGKDHARKLMREFMCTHLDMEGSIGGNRIASSRGLFVRLMQEKGVLFYLLDEIGHMLGGLTSGKAGVYQRDIMTMFTELFSCANSAYSGGDYADPKFRGNDEGGELIDQPCLNVYGVTVPEIFFNAMASSNRLDGFLPRWLVFHSDNPDPDMEMRTINTEPPEELSKKILELRNMPTNVDPQGNVDAISKVRPMVVTHSEEAAKCIGAYMRTVKKRRTWGRRENDGSDMFWARAVEHAMKLALVASAGEATTSGEAMRWSVATVDKAIAALVEKSNEMISDNIQEQTMKRMVQIIKGRRGWMKYRDIVRKTQFMTGRQRRETLESLVEGEMVPFFEYNFVHLWPEYSNVVTNSLHESEQCLIILFLSSLIPDFHPSS